LISADLGLVLVVAHRDLELGGVEAQGLAVLHQVLVLEVDLVVDPLALAGLAALLVGRLGLALALLLEEEVVGGPEALVTLLGAGLEGELRGGLGAGVEGERVVLTDEAD